jgi:hypothetical protein
LIILKRRPTEPPGFFEAPTIIPAAGIAVGLALLTQVKGRAFLIALALLAGIAVLYLISRPQPISEESTS